MARVHSDHAIADVLIVDDHPLMCDALSATLGYAFGLRKVRVAASIAEALESIREEGVPDAVVLDLNLPDAEGVEGVLVLRRAAGAAPLAVISADLEPELVSAAMGAGASGYVGKLLPRAKMVDAFSRIWAGEVVLPEGCERDSPEAGEAAALARGLRLADAAADEHPAADLRGAAEQDHLLRALDRRGDGEDAHRRDHDEDQSA